MRGTGRGGAVRSEMSRRRFGRGAAATVVVVALGGTTAAGRAAAAGRARGFRVEHDRSVWIWMGAGFTFDVEVVRADDGAVLERHEELDLQALLRIRSDHVRFVPARPPGT